MPRCIPEKELSVEPPAVVLDELRTVLCDAGDIPLSGTAS
jgi:hypothetical protein